MKNYLLPAIIAFLLASCQTEEKRPPEVLDPGSMEKVLFDIHLAEGALKANFILGDSASKVAPSLYEEIYRRYGTNEVEFERSLNWYLARPEKMEEIQKSITERLMQEEP